MKSIVYIFLLGLSLSTWAFAFDVPALTGPVVDQTRLLSDSGKQRLENSLFEFRQKYSAQIQVFIVSSLNDEPIENVSIKVFDQWKLGDAKRDDGVLFLIAPKEKKLRIEVGRGLEGVIPDITAKRIISEGVRPYFQRGEFEVGVFQGVQTLQAYISEGVYRDANINADINQQTPVKKTKKTGTPFVFLGLFLIWLLIFFISPSTGLYILFSVLSGGRGGGRGGGGGWSGGGGDSAGGGASGDW